MLQYGLTGKSVTVTAGESYSIATFFDIYSVNNRQLDTALEGYRWWAAFWSGEYWSDGVYRNFTYWLGGTVPAPGFSPPSTPIVHMPTTPGVYSLFSEIPYTANYYLLDFLDEVTSWGYQDGPVPFTYPRDHGCPGHHRFGFDQRRHRL